MKWGHEHVCMWDVYWKAFQAGRKYSAGVLDGCAVPVWSSRGRTEPPWQPQVDQHHGEGFSPDFSQPEFLMIAKVCKGIWILLCHSSQGSVLPCCWGLISRHRTRLSAFVEIQVRMIVWYPYPSTGTTTVTLPSVGGHVEPLEISFSDGRNANTGSHWSTVLMASLKVKYVPYHVTQPFHSTPVFTEKGGSRGKGGGRKSREKEEEVFVFPSVPSGIISNIPKLEIAQMAVHQLVYA